MSLVVALSAAPAGAVFLSQGDRILFSSERGGDFHLYSMGPTGKKVRKIDARKGWQLPGQLSPRGDHVVFWAGPGGGNTDVFTADSSGHHLRRVVRARKKNAYWPSWSPDGKQIAFTLASAHGSELVTTDAQGKHQHVVRKSPNIIAFPVWSPDGSRIGYSEPDAQGDDEIYTIEPSGKHRMKLTNNTVSDEFGDWQSLASRISFTRDVGGVFQLFTMKPDGTGVRQVTSGAQSVGGGLYTPDAKRLIFDRYDGTDYEIYAIGVDGKHQRRLTNNTVDDLVHLDPRA